MAKIDIPNRLKRHCGIFDVPLPIDPSLRRILVSSSAAASGRRRRGTPQYAQEVQQLAEQLTSTAIHF